MSRVTAPMSKMARSLSSSPSGVVVVARSAHGAGASLMPKYAELLHNRRSHEHSDSNPSRGLATTHRPTPQPSLANRTKPLMQTFHSSASPAMHTSTTHIDAAVLPSMSSLVGSSKPGHGPRMPLLPDNYGAAHVPMATETMAMPEVTIVAADPDNVVPGAPKAGVQGLGLDGVELKFLYDESSQPRQEQERSGMIRDIWKGMVEDVFGGTPNKAI
ncbi:hypothetical protein EsDP_00001397 [Epichloe bromicola]|uniref:Uncharacterized protein n=1 Tax=Epichloe bromicola TaxID=79588 RepID=A0ABQ0CHQ7_9HYPO